MQTVREEIISISDTDIWRQLTEENLNYVHKTIYHQLILLKSFIGLNVSTTGVCSNEDKTLIMGKIIFSITTFEKLKTLNPDYSSVISLWIEKLNHWKTLIDPQPRLQLNPWQAMNKLINIIHQLV